MNTFVNAINNEMTTTTTENGGVTYSTALDAVVDMFFQIGAVRGQSYEEICSIVSPAFKQDPGLAFRVALWSRDIREGAGERQTFRHILKFLLSNKEYKQYAYRAISPILELGRADDLFVLLDDNDVARVVLDFISHYLVYDKNSLVAKWMPRKGLIAARIRNYMGLSAKQYRQLLVSLTNVVETDMCKKNWSGINYSHVPSVAMSRYSRAFTRHDEERFIGWKERVKTGGVNPETGKVDKVNTGAVYPHNIITMSDKETKSLMWDNLPDFVPENISFLPIIDTSGSMATHISKDSSVTCMDVAISLGIYLAERNKTQFKDYWLSFSQRPNFHKLDGDDINSKLDSINYHDWGMNTDLGKALELIVNMAVENQVQPEDMPNYLLILSDMEFDSYGNKAPGKEAQNLFDAAGYKMPNIVWWNIQSRNGSTPVRANDKGMALVSGFSPAIMQNLLKGEITPLKIMLETIMKDRYSY